MSYQEQLTRRSFLRSAAVGATACLAGCAPQVVKETVIVKEKVEKLVKETVVVKEAVEVEKEVTRVVEKVVEKQITAKPAPAGPVTVKYTARAGAATKPSGSEWPIHLDALQEFMAENPNIKVELIEIPTSQLSDFYAKLTTMIASGTVGDFTWLHASDSDHSRLAYMQALAPIDEYVESEGVDLAKYFPAAVDGMRFEGQLYGLPFTMHSGGSSIFYYNQDLFEEKGLALPNENSTLDDLLGWAQELTSDDRYGFRPNLNGSQSQETWLRQFGGHPLSEDGKTSAMNTPEALEYAKYVHGLYQVDKVSPLEADMPSGGLNAMFSSGKLAMFQNGPWGINSAKLAVGEAFTIGMMPAPKGPSGLRGYSGYVDSWAMTTQSKHKPETFKAMHAMACFRSGVLRLSLREGLTAMPSVYEDPQFKDNANAQLIYSVVKQCMAQRHPWNFRGAEHATVLNNELALMWLGKQDPTQAYMESVAEKANNILAKPR